MFFLVYHMPMIPMFSLVYHMPMIPMFSLVCHYMCMGFYHFAVKETS